ncbi:hypothetical protein BDY17DRAFT_323755 [Neohortaea acidophila]|uniref:Uncharacterized protein n=1 Tax=Neohortaea acidophila TaxID=245834 RepID=A0A6A6PSA9_9PEZI|nr:uncharacterized protein BDY17DRAFT_323755 [Neohortaea acidophila]KAF2482988.1 hypothetical protein BDY17DRAFT_323755 [Neohortaea acidophila]
MASASPDDDLLSILLVNLRNAAATFGEGSPPYEAIRTVVEEHLQSMKAAGAKTNLTTIRKSERPDAPSPEKQSGNVNTLSFANLAFRPKPI